MGYRGIWDESLLSFSGLRRTSSSVHGFVLLPRPQPALRRGSPMGVRFWWILLLPRCAPSIFVEHPLTFPHSVSRCRSGEYIRSMPSLEPLAPRPTRLGRSGGRAPLSYRGMLFIRPARGACWSRAGRALVLESLKMVFSSSSVFLPGGRAPVSYGRPPQCKTDNGQLTTGQPFRLVELAGCQLSV